MAWIETTDERNRRSRTYEQGGETRWSGTLAALHYEGALDSGIYNTEIDVTPVRVDNPQFDGWRVVANGWHHALGKDIANHGDQDGWIGFAGRQGQNWFKFRLLRVGYLHWPTRGWQDIGGAPTYDRSDLSQETSTLTIGPNDDQITVQSIASWANIWNTPGGGQLDIAWKVRGDQLKEEVVVNQAAREWIAANEPPTTPLPETWFGFVFSLDWSDVPKCVRDGVEQDVDGDFSDDGENIELRDALDRLLGFMPMDYVTAGTRTKPERAQLRKRFYKDGDDYYLLVGVRCDVLNGLQAGDLVFDPTVNEQVDADADDGTEYPQDTWGATATWFGHYGVSDEWSCTRFQTVNVPQAANITVATYTLTEKQHEGGPYTVNAKVRGEDIDDADAPGAANLPSDMTLTGAGVDLDVHTDDWNDNEETEITVTAVIQEIVDIGTWAANNDMNIVIENDGTAGDQDMEFYDHNIDNGKAATLDITYSTESPSISPSASESPSISPSASASPSASISPSASESPSVSPSASISPSASASPSASPSPGWEDYTKGDYAALPGNDDDLETNYTPQEVLDVATKNDVRVPQSAFPQQYTIHQYKDFVGAEGSCLLECELQSSLAPNASTVFLQIYNQDTPAWETVDSDNVTGADVDFTLLATVPDLTDYKDGSNVISCRVWQFIT